MYAITFKFQIHGCFASMSSQDIFLERVAELPFMPGVGMNFSDGGEWSATVREVTYNVETGAVSVWCGEDKEIYNAQLKRQAHRRVEEIAAEYVALGWRVRA